jgi:predicted SprT family Zn-dependent metalloprotease
MSEFVCDVDKDGEYEFKAVLKWVPGEYDERGCSTMRDYLEVEHIEFNLIQTFQQRERQSKLDEILSKELEDIFNF